nr:endoglucanase 1-like [Aegilops tauschii subsp. strangulata]
MASNDEVRGSGDCNVYEAADAYLNLLDEQRLLQAPPVTSETETDIETGAETETGTETDEAGIEPKPKRIRCPNQLITTTLVVTEVDSGNFDDADEDDDVEDADGPGNDDTGQDEDMIDNGGGEDAGHGGREGARHGSGENMDSTPQSSSVGLDDGTNADIDTDGADTDGGAETGGEGTGGEDTGREGEATPACSRKPYFSDEA